MPDAFKPGQPIDIPSVPNLRDLGGWPTADGGRVRRGLLYRSTELAQLAGADMVAFAGLGIRTVFDLRTEAERRQQPDVLPPGTQHVVLDVLKDSKDAAPAEVYKVIADPKAAQELLGDGKAVALFKAGYRETVGLSSALAGFRRFFADVAHAAHRPALFHCTTGKDRTGWAAATTLMLLGVSDDDVMDDYLLTNAQLLPSLKPVFDGFAAKGGDPAVLRPVFGVERDYLEAALDEMRTRFGTVEQYFSDGLGLDAAVQDTLRETLVERA